MGAEAEPPTETTAIVPAAHGFASMAASTAAEHRPTSAIINS